MIGRTSTPSQLASVHAQASQNMASSFENSQQDTTSIELTQPFQFISQSLFQSDDENDEAPVPHASVPCITSSNAASGVPTTYQAAIAIMSLINLCLQKLKNIILAIKITGGVRLKKGLKVKVIAIQMVQKKFILDDVMEYIKRKDSGNMRDSARRLVSFSERGVRETKDVDGNAKIERVSGDVPQFDDEVEIIPIDDDEFMRPKIPVIASQRQPEFTANEYCRPLHFLQDGRMSIARQLLLHARTKEPQDMVYVDPWDDHIVDLFNDTTFQPKPVHILRGGLTRSDISRLDPSTRPQIRIANTLKNKFSELKSQYTVCCSNFEASGKGDGECFVIFAQCKSYIMYTHCFAGIYPVLECLFTRSIPSTAQREIGVETVDKFTDRDDMSIPKKKEKKNEHSIEVKGLEPIKNLAQAFGSADAGSTTRTKVLICAEEDKAMADAELTKEKVRQSILDSIFKTNELLKSTDDEIERDKLKKFISFSMDKLMA